MRSLCLMSLGLLLASGCADTAEDYDVNKPVISEPADDMPVTQPETGVDMDADLDNSETPGAVDANPSAGAIDTDPATDSLEDNAASDENQPIVP